MTKGAWNLSGLWAPNLILNIDKENIKDGAIVQVKKQNLLAEVMKHNVNHYNFRFQLNNMFYKVENDMTIYIE